MTVLSKELLALSDEDKIDIALELWETIKDKGSSVEISAEDEQVLENRFKDHQKDPKIGKPWAEIKKEI